ncbi:hypothetical protein ACLM5H_01290 [Fredinandcohnia humi]
MMNPNQIEQFVRSVYDAQKAVIESQGNDDPAHFQHAQNMVYQAKQQLLEVDKTYNGTEEEKKVLHAKELLRQLEETQHAIEATDEF